MTSIPDFLSEVLKTRLAFWNLYKILSMGTYQDIFTTLCQISDEKAAGLWKSSVRFIAVFDILNDLKIVEDHTHKGISEQC